MGTTEAPVAPSLLGASGRQAVTTASDSRLRRLGDAKSGAKGWRREELCLQPRSSRLVGRWLRRFAAATVRGGFRREECDRWGLSRRGSSVRLGNVRACWAAARRFRPLDDILPAEP